MNAVCIIGHCTDYKPPDAVQVDLYEELKFEKG